jgi:hypothetical protein
LIELVALHPVLQLDQLALQAEQLLEIEAAINGRPVGMLCRLSKQLAEALVVNFKLELFIEAIDDFPMETVLERLGAFVHRSRTG